MPADDSRNREYAAKHRLPFRSRWTVRVVSGSMYGYPCGMLDMFFSSYRLARKAIQEYEDGNRQRPA